uniref:CHK domain-containing protein n=1 Tax=Glossina brevipalpis TaxID=37001 RepID=A0A1A9WA04_9MUSC
MALKLPDKYVKNHLVPQIMEHLHNEEFISYEADHSPGLDGFMSTLYNMKLKTKTAECVKERWLLVKTMRGDRNFRESSKSYIQFANEIYVYNTVLAAFNESAGECAVKVNDLLPKCYVAMLGYIDGLSSSFNDLESILVLEHLKPLGYQMGPRLFLNSEHLLAMSCLLGQYHAFSYTVKSIDIVKWEQLIAGIKSLPFIDIKHPDKDKNNFYRVIYRVAFDRFFDYLERHKDDNIFDKSNEKDLKLIDNLKKLREKYFHEPCELLENLRTKVLISEEDNKFAVILHGDYNRNNVLFKYKNQGEENVPDDVEDIKMFDFQELRYGSPALDLSFFMYFNTPEDIRSEIWPKLLLSYHTNMISVLSSNLEAHHKSLEDTSKILSYYSFENFQKHFARFAFYGVMICLHFLPWMSCSEQECERLSELFAININSDEFYELSMKAGGDMVNDKLLAIVRHANDMGYMDHM